MPLRPLGSAGRLSSAWLVGSEYLNAYTLTHHWSAKDTKGLSLHHVCSKEKRDSREGLSHLYRSWEPLRERRSLQLREREYAVYKLQRPGEMTSQRLEVPKTLSLPHMDVVAQTARCRETMSRRKRVCLLESFWIHSIKRE